MKLHYLLLSLGILFSVIALVAVGSRVEFGGNPDRSLFLLMLLILPLVPLALPVIAGWFFRWSKPALLVCLAGLISAFAFMAYAFVNSFHINSDPQGGLILIFRPIYTLFGLIPFGIAALVLFLRRASQTQ